MNSTDSVNHGSDQVPRTTASGSQSAARSPPIGNQLGLVAEVIDQDARRGRTAGIETPTIASTVRTRSVYLARLDRRPACRRTIDVRNQMIPAPSASDSVVGSLGLISLEHVEAWTGTSTRCRSKTFSIVRTYWIADRLGRSRQCTLIRCTSAGGGAGARRARARRVRRRVVRRRRAANVDERDREQHHDHRDQPADDEASHQCVHVVPLHPDTGAWIERLA